MNSSNTNYRFIEFCFNRPFRQGGFIGKSGGVDDRIPRESEIKIESEFLNMWSRGSKITSVSYSGLFL